MTICIVVLSTPELAIEITTSLKKTETPLVNCQLIRPLSDMSFSQEMGVTTNEEWQRSYSLKPVEIQSIKLLNPKLTRKERQKSLAMLLMPFGFISGLAFTKMTGLQTFSNLGFGSLGEPITGSLLGMFSGWIGSHAAAASVNSDKNDDIRSLRKYNESGKWLLLLETPIEIELPWQLIQKTNPISIVRLRDL